MKLKSTYFKFSLGIFVFLILALIIYFGFYFKNEAAVNNDVKNEGESTIVSDIDGNLYHTVQIGDQTWLQENLKTSHYRNGDPIANVTNLTDWWNLNTGAYGWYNNDTKIGEVYGALYNWYTVNDPRGLAIAGWHVPTVQEWANLVTRASADVGLIFVVYNLRRIMNIIGQQKLKELFKTLIFVFRLIMAYFKAVSQNICFDVMKTLLKNTSPISNLLPNFNLTFSPKIAFAGGF